MVAIPNPNGTYFDDALFDDFGYGFDVDTTQYLALNRVRKMERTTPGSGQRQEIARAERTAPGVGRRVDD